MPVITPDDMQVEETRGGICGPKSARWIGDIGDLTQFGALIETLPPGSSSSVKHWHAAEDEMVFVLDGEVTLIEGETETILRPGDAATFKAGVAVGHCLVNRSSEPTRCLVVGTRAPVDVITYPDHDRICHRDRSAPDDVWTDRGGHPAAAL